MQMNNNNFNIHNNKYDSTFIPIQYTIPHKRTIQTSNLYLIPSKK